MNTGKCLIVLLIVLAMLVQVRAESCQSYDRVTGTVLEDKDCDVLPDQADNCPLVANQGQEDSDKDGIGDACESIKSADQAGLPSPGFSDVVVQAVSSHDLEAGGLGEFYAIRLTNQGKDPAVISIAVAGLSWGTYVIKPGKVVLVESGETLEVFIFVKAMETAFAGEHTFSVTLDMEGKTKRLDFSAYVVHGSRAQGWSDVRIETAFIVIAILLFIIGLIIGMMRLRGKNQ